MRLTVGISARIYQRYWRRLSNVQDGAYRRPFNAFHYPQFQKSGAENCPRIARRNKGLGFPFLQQVDSYHYRWVRLIHYRSHRTLVRFDHLAGVYNGQPRFFHISGGANVNQRLLAHQGNIYILLFRRHHGAFYDFIGSIISTCRINRDYHELF